MAGDRGKTGGTGFQPVSPWTSESLTVGRRHLPHLQVNGATYFLTFRCRPRLCLPPTGRTIVLNAIRYWDGNRIDLDAAVVMPDHAHAILRITDGSALETILHSIKSFSANRVNRLLQRRGAFWQDENFDHIERGETDWQNKLEYVRNNPVKKGLCDNPEGYPWLYIRNLQ